MFHFWFLIFTLRQHCYNVVWEAKRHVSSMQEQDEHTGFLAMIISVHSQEFSSGGFGDRKIFAVPLFCITWLRWHSSMCTNCVRIVPPLAFWIFSNVCMSRFLRIPCVSAHHLNPALEWQTMQSTIYRSNSWVRIHLAIIRIMQAINGINNRIWFDGKTTGLQL